MLLKAQESIFTHCIRFGIDWGLCTDKMKSFITWLGSFVRLNPEIYELLGINLNFFCLCILQAIFCYLGCSGKQTILGTLQTMAVLAPIRAAWMH